MNINEKIILITDSFIEKFFLKKIINNLFIHTNYVRELLPEVTEPSKYVKILSLLASMKVSALFPKNLIISINTIVTLNNKILKNIIIKKNMFLTLRLINNKKCKIITCYVISCNYKNYMRTKVMSTNISLKKIRDNEVKKHAKILNFLSKTSKFDIKDFCFYFVKYAKGPHSNVFNSPIWEIITDLQELNGFR